MSRMQVIKEYLVVLLGSTIMALSFNLFLTPNKVAAGGISGLAIIIYHLLHVPVGLSIILLNLPLFIMGLKVFGLRFITRSVFGAVAMSLMIEVLAPLPALTSDLLLASVFGGIVMGVGLAVVFRGRGSTGGTVLAAQLLNRFFGFTVGQSLLGADFLVIALAGVFFNLELALYALISIFVTSRVVDLIQEGFSTSKAALIISDQAEAISRRILHDLERGATVMTGKGAYSGLTREMVLTVVSQAEVQRLKKLVHETDPRAFVIVSNAHEVLGEGFARPDTGNE